MRTLALGIGLCALALIGCGKSASSGNGTKVTLTTTEVGPALPVDHPDVPPPPLPKVSADVQRVSIYQLRNSLSQVLGADDGGTPITWMVNTTTSGFDRYASTLGVPDYINITEQDLGTSALYVKFMGDMARDGCNRALQTDLGRTDTTTRVLLRYVAPTDTVATNPTGVDQNLRYLLLRFHGIKVADDQTAPLDPWRALFTKVVTAAAKGGTPSQANVTTGWHAVCVALLTAPEFHLY